MLLGPSQKRKRVSKLLLSFFNNVKTELEVGLLLFWDLRKQIGTKVEKIKRV